MVEIVRAAAGLQTHTHTCVSHVCVCGLQTHTHTCTLTSSTDTIPIRRRIFDHGPDLPGRINRAGSTEIRAGCESDFRLRFGAEIRVSDTPPDRIGIVGGGGGGGPHRHRIGTESAPNRHRIGTESAPNRDRIGTESAPNRHRIGIVEIRAGCCPSTPPEPEEAPGSVTQIRICSALESSALRSPPGDGVRPPAPVCPAA
jgi:hypothetical protein